MSKIWKFTRPIASSNSAYTESPPLPELLHPETGAPRILAECAIAERLRRIPGIELHPTLFNTPFIYGPEDARAAMTALYHEYLHTAARTKLPILLTAPTWRLDATRIAEAKVPARINTDAVAFLQKLRDDFIAEHAPEAPVLVGALIGPRNDCYRPDLAPSADEAEAFHRPQIDELAATPADFLLAQTLPAVGEAIGIARLASRTEKPYLISFCAGPDGNVLDGTPLPEAAANVVQAEGLTRPPAGFMVNCTHPRFLLNAYEPGQLDAYVGIQANGSSKDVTALDGSGATEIDPIDPWAADMLSLHQTHAFTILGGCCGTSTRHMETLAANQS